MYARITTMHMLDCANLDETREVTPRLWSGAMAQPGCLGGFVLTDPVAGTVHAITFWNDAEGMIAARHTGKVIAANAEALLNTTPASVVQVLEVVGLDLEAVLANANRRGQQWPVLHPATPRPEDVDPAAGEGVLTAERPSSRCT
jgi:hypothetical protein